MASGDDWRITNQATYLRGARLRWQLWEPADPENDHDHCDFCWVHFARTVLSDDPDTQLSGYCTDDRQHWICRGCFDDFAERFSFEVVGAPPDR